MRQQVLIGLRSWLAAAVLVAMAVLLGASAGGVVAARATPARVAVGGGHAEADATPAGTTAPDDGNAEVVARKVIDADGDLDTIDDQTAAKGGSSSSSWPMGRSKNRSRLPARPALPAG